MKTVVKNLGKVNYRDCYEAMQSYTKSRHDQSDDQLWFVEHPPVYTQGLNGKEEHLIHTANIPVIQTDRGGQVTYHGPGQIIMYCLFDLKRKGIGVRQFVTLLEECVIQLLQSYYLDAMRKKGAPGVYINDKKIAALGLRVKHGCTYHGLSLNWNMDLTPFKGINPCGYADLRVTQLSALGVKDEKQVVIAKLVDRVTEKLRLTGNLIIAESDKSTDGIKAA